MSLIPISLYKVIYSGSESSFVMNSRDDLSHFASSSSFWREGYNSLCLLFEVRLLQQTQPFPKMSSTTTTSNKTGMFQKRRRRRRRTMLAIATTALLAEAAGSLVVVVAGETALSETSSSSSSTSSSSNPTRTTTTRSYRFAVVPKRLNSPYWDAVRAGCEMRAQRLSSSRSGYDDNDNDDNDNDNDDDSNVTCLFTGPAEGGPDTEENQIRIVQELLTVNEDDPEHHNQIDGLALAVVESDSARRLIDQAMRQGIPVVTIDSDVIRNNDDDSTGNNRNTKHQQQRLAYIGTDNFALGMELGQVLLQIQPEGGTYAMVGAGSPNIQLRIEGVRAALSDSGWVEMAHVSSPSDCGGDPARAVQQMFGFVAAQASTDIDNDDSPLGAVIPVGAWPMLDAVAWRGFVDAHPHVLTVVADALQEQIDLMNMGYASALVGQLPFEMGSVAIDKLLEFRQKQEAGDDDLSSLYNGINDEFHTSFLNVINIPQDLPPLQTDMNYIGHLRILGYAMFAMIFFLSVGFFAFAVRYRNNDVIRKSQPFFLYMICLGIVLMGSAIIPLTIDDEYRSQQACDAACMSIPWLLSIGFVTTLSALFSKIWRVNLIFNNPHKFKRIKVEEKDVIVPFTILMTANIIVLLCWTLIAPLQFERKASSGTDNWNRVYKSYYGVCVSTSEGVGGSTAYVFPIILAAINLSTLILANIQAYRARKIKVEYSESHYMAMAMVCMLEALVIGVPIIALVRENPQVNFIVFTILIFVMCMAILLLIFVPKVVYTRQRVTGDHKKRTTSLQNAVVSGDRELVQDMSMRIEDLQTSGLTKGTSSSSGIIIPIGGGTSRRIREDNCRMKTDSEEQAREDLSGLNFTLED